MEEEIDNSTNSSMDTVSFPYDNDSNGVNGVSDDDLIYSDNVG